MNDLLDLLGRASARPTSARFVTARGTRDTSFGEMWEMSGRAATAIERSPQRTPLAGLLTPSPEMIACFVGCLRAGRDFVSMPLPGRGQSAAAYAAQTRVILELSGAEEVIVEAASAPGFAGAPSEIGGRLSIAEAIVASGEGARPARDRAPGDIVQFSSGTTGAPKGVRLSTAAVGASVEATLDAIEVGHADVSCQWVPLSHDMGLIGGLLGTWARMGRYVCLGPELFLVRPTLWMETCAAHRATVTTAPTFAYQILARQLDRAPAMDLGALRVAIVGAEPVGAETLRAFARSALRHGFDERAFCPAYGLAEATLTVSILAPSEPWSTARVDVAGRQTEVVSCGRVLRSVEVLAPEQARGPGPILIRGASVCQELVPHRPRRDDGWLDTGDLGALAGGELLVTGRSDDMLCIAGRNVFAWELEQEAARCAGVRPGNCVAVADGQGRYVVMFEPQGDAAPRDALLDVRRRLAGFAGVGPSGVGCLPRGRLPKTPSGKIQRNTLRAELDRYVGTCCDFQEF